MCCQSWSGRTESTAAVTTLFKAILMLSVFLGYLNLCVKGRCPLCVSKCCSPTSSWCYLAKKTVFSLICWGFQISADKLWIWCCGPTIIQVKGISFMLLKLLINFKLGTETMSLWRGIIHRTGQLCRKSSRTIKCNVSVPWTQLRSRLLYPMLGAGL